MVTGLLIRLQGSGGLCPDLNRMTVISIISEKSSPYGIFVLSYLYYILLVTDTDYSSPTITQSYLIECTTHIYDIENPDSMFNLNLPRITRIIYDAL